MEKERSVAIYARVSTEHEAQISALDNQIQYYDNLLNQHPEWKLYERYIDEGITGTSIKKRKNFLRMMEDAADGHFDLIITREVSRFARNTVDTLLKTRELKKLGVEVYFTEDNIWTMNDEDGELRLTIMATLAQNESKKTSLRVKAGQKVSFQNAVPYGNGNILGYDRVGKEMVINEEQAKTVRMIFDMYLDGKGMRRIQDELELAGRKTSTGLTRWYPAYISRVLNNPFYCGTIVYRKEYVPEYLEQKKVRNWGDVEQVVVEGKHTPIVTKEEFARVREILDTKTTSLENRGKRGKQAGVDVWSRKAKCYCGTSLNRRQWHKQEGKEPQYCYHCHAQVRTGTIAHRLKKGLPIDGICDTPMVPAWKFETMASVIFRELWEKKKAIYEFTNEMLEKHIHDDDDDTLEKISELNRKSEKLDQKYDNLVEMRMNGEIDKFTFDKKKEQLQQEKKQINDKIAAYTHEEEITNDDYERKLTVLKYAVEENFDFSSNSIPEEVINAFVDEIIVYPDCFVWKLNIFNDIIRMKIEGRKNHTEVSLMDTPPFDNSCAGSDCEQVKQTTKGLYRIEKGKPEASLFIFILFHSHTRPRRMKSAPSGLWRIRLSLFDILSR